MTLEELFKYVKTHEIDLNELFKFDIQVQTDVYFTMSDKPETTNFELKEIEINAFDHKITLIGDNK